MNRKARKTLLSLVLVSLLFAVACSPAQRVAVDEPVISSSTGDLDTFQEYLWFENPVVLIVQIGLMLAGALGVAALLPAPDEDEEEESG
jgi:hypothetical protein